MARQPGARTQLAVAFETTYGTAPATGYTRVPFASAALGAEQPLLANELLGYGRDPLAPVLDALTADGSVVVPVDLRAIGFWLKGAFGASAPTEDDGVFTHTFQSGGWTLPSMSIEVQMPEAPRFAMYSGVKVDTIGWRMERSGLLTANVGLIAQGESVASSTAAGTLASQVLTRFGHFSGAISRNGSALGSVVSNEFSYQNNLDRIEVIRADGKIDGLDTSIAALTGSMEVRFADSTLIDQAIAGTPCELSFSYSLSASASLTFVAHAVYLPRPRLQIAGPQGVLATFDWQAALAASPARMCTVTLVNDVAAY
jgi:hypothetical protein